MNGKTGIMVGAAPIGREEKELADLLQRKNIYKVAVDGGIEYFINNNIRPDYWLGDMDSVGKEYYNSDIVSGVKKLELSPIKDDTDMALAIKDAFDNGCSEVTIFGGTGGKRLSHTLANIQLIYGYALRGKHITMVSEHSRMYVLYNDSIEYSPQKKGLISIFALNDVAKGVRIEGLFYEYVGDLGNNRSLGVSNEFCGRIATVGVADGALLIVEEYV